MKRLIARLWKDTDGQDLIEYGLLAALMGVACIAGILELSRLITFFADLGEVLRNAI